MPDLDLSVTVGPLRLKNPVMPASGTFGWAQEFAAFFDPAALGAVVRKTITLKPRAGNPPKRVVETVGGMLNAIGLQNPGFEVFARDYWPYLRSLDTVRIVNIAGETEVDFAACAAAAVGLDGVDALELNTSCPNVDREGRIFGTDPDRTRAMVAAVRREVGRLPLIVKLTPNVTDVTTIGRAAMEGGADILALTNTLLGMAINADTGRPVIANVRGGLSGPAIKPVALRMVYDTVRTLKAPVIGIGGIRSGRDAAEFLMAGASAVQVGTASFADPSACMRIVTELAGFLESKGHGSVGAIIGLAHRE